VTKILGTFDVQKVRESKKHEKNKQIYFALLKPNERDCLENPRFNGKYIHVLNKLSNN
jgi:hypothetical protein